MTLDDVSYFIHLSIHGKLLNYSSTSSPKAMYMMVTYLRVDLGKAQQELDDTRGCHAKVFIFDGFVSAPLGCSSR